MISNTELERLRTGLQARLDEEKSHSERNKLGQFSTPWVLAHDMVIQSSQYLQEQERIRFFDPAFGTGVFLSALHEVIGSQQITHANGIELDPHYARPAQDLWADTNLELLQGDFLAQPVPSKPRHNFLICNPPYVRHHYIPNKKRLQEIVQKDTGFRLSGLAGLYCYFLLFAQCWLEEDGLAVWLLPGEFMDVNYGEEVKRYLLSAVTVLKIHRFTLEAACFDDAQVTSTVLWLKNKKPATGDNIIFSSGDKLLKPDFEQHIPTDQLNAKHKWGRYFTPASFGRKSTAQNNSVCLGDYFRIRRGIATGDNRYFILSRQELEQRQLPLNLFKPVLPGSRHLKTRVVEADVEGYPILEQQMFVLDCRSELSDIKQRYPALYDYLQEGVASGVAERYLCRKRKFWYAQEVREPGHFYCAYMGRTDAQRSKNPFRFIYNKSSAIVTNTWLILYPKPELAGKIACDPDLTEQIHNALEQLDTEQMLMHSRVYGGGMHKLEPKELARVDASSIAKLIDK